MLDRERFVLGCGRNLKRIISLPVDPKVSKTRTIERGIRRGQR